MIARVLGVMGVVSVGFLAFLIFTSNPFERLLPAVAEGRDLNPLLQDPGMIIHPPMLYLGYVGFLGAVRVRDRGAARRPHRRALAALDAAVDQRRLGVPDRSASRWAAGGRTTSWAGAAGGSGIRSRTRSFMPWLAGAALLHSQAVTEKRGSFRGWTLLLAIATFSLSLLGTFLVRSGVLTSVHAFASDPTRGLFILIFLGIVIGGSLLLYALRAPSNDDDGAAVRRRPRARRCCWPTTCCCRPPARWCCSARCIRCSPTRWTWARSRSARPTSR